MSDTWTDGAGDGLKATEGAERAIAGKPAPPKTLTPAEMASYLAGDDNPWGTDEDGYNESARLLGRFILENLRAHADLQDAPIMSKYDLDSWDGNGPAPVIVAGLDKRLEVLDYAGYKQAVDGVTGFMWGWAVNAARYALDLPQQPNPALVTVGGS